jgi:hypothetical protein
VQLELAAVGVEVCDWGAAEGGADCWVGAGEEVVVGGHGVGGKG